MFYLAKLFRKQIKHKKIVDVDPIKFKEMKAVSLENYATNVSFVQALPAKRNSQKIFLWSKLNGYCYMFALSRHITNFGGNSTFYNVAPVVIVNSDLILQRLCV